ncbi:hypothetical protein [Nocardia cerradoensis]|uniref:Uncharacterized protein n=2 Tax=Nocardia cerradoensis TaxID=85688 RepID=A0A231GYB0_9NOCA|nr:hypothetical protein [Nocardia cerradoensis]NKY43314.1 hypothetical protein [Nocardia cerradoensis]OXR41580.1 hypothetical protein B7C42_06221 [Nocardia cerradoensis]
MARLAHFGIVLAAAVGAAVAALPSVAADPPAGAGVHISASADNRKCQVTFKIDNYTNAHNWYTLDYWFSQEDQPWAPPDAEPLPSGWPDPLPSPWRFVPGAKKPVARYTPPSPDDSPGSIRGALPADFPAADRYQAPYTNFNPSALSTPFTTTVTFDLRTVDPAPPTTTDGTYTLRYRVYLGPQTETYGQLVPKSVTVGGCNSGGGSSGSADMGSSGSADMGSSGSAGA